MFGQFSVFFFLQFSHVPAAPSPALVGEEERLYMCSAALSSFPAETLSWQLMRDDRILKRFDQLRALAELEVKRLGVMPEYIVKRLAYAISTDFPSEKLQAAVMRSALASTAYMKDHIWDMFEQYPFKLAIGDIEHNLRKLARDTGTITDPTTLQILALLRRGCRVVKPRGDIKY